MGWNCLQECRIKHVASGESDLAFSIKVRCVTSCAIVAHTFIRAQWTTYSTDCPRLNVTGEQCVLGILDTYCLEINFKKGKKKKKKKEMKKEKQKVKAMHAAQISQLSEGTRPLP